MAERGAPVSRREALAAKMKRRAGRRWLVLKEPIIVRDVLAHPAFLPVAGIAVAFVIAATLTVWLSRGGLLIVPGRVMTETRTVRVEFSDIDEEQTRAQRELRRTLAPRVYRADRKLLDEIENSVRALPAVLAAAGEIDKVIPEVARTFRLTPERFESLKAQTADGQPSQTWQARAESLAGLLSRAPLLARAEFQVALQDGTERLELRVGEAVTETVGKFDAMNVDSNEPDMRAKIRRRFEAIVREAGFYEAGPEVAGSIADRLDDLDAPLFAFDREGTEQRRQEAAAGVDPVRVTHKPGEIIYRRGESLGPDAFGLALRENDVFRAAAPLPARLLEALGLVGLCAAMAGALGGYIGVFYRSLAVSPWRLGALAGLMIAALVGACVGSLSYPSVLWFTSVAPVVALAMVCVIAYDRRLVLAVAGSQAVLTGLALSLPVTHIVVAMVGIAAVAWQLNDLRHRSDVVRSGLIVAAALGVAMVAVALLERPMVPGAWGETLRDAGWALAAGFLPAVMILALLPTIEKAFDITTGMTLSELRDPKHPLLRQLQERAPGTYNHAQTVAVLAESAAEAIGADGLHVYVGALYHDIGKMNKPEYFVENQQGGVSRHSRLSPAMSLLVIVGHVKDGVELAREYRLPHSLHHYIESHHGTTLVEYFFDAARRQAEDDDRDGPNELEYRYPGPRPRTREAAILMLCDAVESATRAMTEPTPARIATLVHSLASKRLADGQFDDCGLTMRDLSRIEEAIVKSLCSLYHSRIAYPRGEDEIIGDARRQAIERTA